MKRHDIPRSARVFVSRAALIGTGASLRAELRSANLAPENLVWSVWRRRLSAFSRSRVSSLRTGPAVGDFARGQPRGGII
jgi:hypothetical protein